MMLFFSKGGFLNDKNAILLRPKNLHISLGSLRGEPMILSKIPIIFRAYFSVKETLVLSFHDVDFLQGGFLDDKNVI